MKSSHGEKKQGEKLEFACSYSQIHMVQTQGTTSRAGPNWPERKTTTVIWQQLKTLTFQP